MRSITGTVSSMARGSHGIKMDKWNMRDPGRMESGMACPGLGTRTVKSFLRVSGRTANMFRGPKNTGTKKANVLPRMMRLWRIRGSKGCPTHHRNIDLPPLETIS